MSRSVWLGHHQILGRKVLSTFKLLESTPPTGIRAVHFSAAAAAGFDRTSARGELDWCAGIGSHNLLLRGGELGVPDATLERREPRRILRGRHLSWRAANRASRRRLWLLVWIIPIKDPEGNP